MSYNTEFEDIMDNINNIAYGYGFKNGIEWANAAQKAGEISWGTYKKYENVHNLRVRYSHGNARDIAISYETYQIVLNYQNDIENSRIRRRNSGGYSNNSGRHNTPKLPDGTFRGKPYIKEFVRKGKDGEEYFFRFSIYRENNYLDDGYHGTTGFGYFIHIDAAPYWNYAKERLHEFHLIRTPYDYHICWNKIIEGFDEANAVMYVWVNRYADLLDVLKKDKTISEQELVSKANKKSVLPSGTFRYKSNKFKNYEHKRKTISMTREVYNEIMEILGTKKPELGGMLGFTLDQDFIDSFVFDEKGKVNSVAYSPNTEFLNGVIQGEWEKKRIFLGGFVHSHPGDFNRLSFDDIEYAQRIMNAFDMTYLFMPIVTSSYEYKTSITGYIVKINGRIEKVNINVVPGKSKTNKILDDEKIDENLIKLAEAGFNEMDSQRKESPVLNDDLNDDNQLSDDNVFARISNVIDIDYMKDCSIIGFGCGGSKGFYEDMARMGVANFYLMDGDKASFSNIASQNGYISEVGMYKPDLIKKRILDINENANVVCFNFMLNDELDDNYVFEHIISKCNLKRTLICAFTDSFYAQARISRIALKYKIPFISGEHHEGGTTSELIFWYPGLTKYSRREIAKHRYDSYADGFVNNVTSVGSPIFNTTRLNALCEKIGLGMLLYDGYPTHAYCSFLNLKTENNLILIKQKYISEENVLFDYFENTVNSCFDEVSWINPESMEDLESIILEETYVDDTRDIFKKKNV